MGFWNSRKIIFALLFAIIGFLSLQVNLFAYQGLGGRFFTWFEFIGPQAGAFLGPFAGFAATALSRVFNLLFFGKALDAGSAVSLFTLAFASLYFGTSPKEKFTGKLALAVPLLAIAIFLLNPVGRQVWYFTLFWFIPVAALFFDSLIAKALGATFTAHAVGGAMWMWLLPVAQSAAYWNALVPVVPIERLLYALGIAAGYVIFNTVLAKVEAMANTGVLHVDPRYVLSRKGFAKA